MTEKAAKLDRDTFGVDGAHGPWQQRLAEIGGIKPLAFEFPQFIPLAPSRTRPSPPFFCCGPVWPSRTNRCGRFIQS
jgi:hypothetical protein